MEIEYKVVSTDTEEICGISHYIGVYIAEGFRDKFWQITCPCGDTVVYPLNGLPEVNTPMPCGDERHWAVKYGPNTLKEMK